MPDLLTTTVFGNTLRDYLVAVIIFCVVVLGLGLVKVAVLHRLNELAKRTPTDFDDFLMGLLSRHVGPVLYILLAVYLSSSMLTFPEKVQTVIRWVVIISFTIKAIQVLQALLIFMLMRWTLGQQKTSPMTAAMVRNMTVVIRMALWAGGALFILDNLGINITAFIAGLGIGGVAIALASQAILGDAFSSFAIFMDRPFEVGDFIVVGDFMGEVEHIGFKTTRIRSLGGEQLIFPNSDLTTSRIRNYKRMQERRVVFKLGIIYETPYEKVERIPHLVREIISGHETARFDRAHFASYGDFALVFEVVYYVRSADYNQYMDLQQSINLKIMRTFQEQGIEFAYPTQRAYTTHVPGHGGSPAVPD